MLGACRGAVAPNAGMNKIDLAADLGDAVRLRPRGAGRASPVMRRQDIRDSAGSAGGRLSARPADVPSGVGAEPRPAAGTGLLRLGLDGARDGMVYVPPTYRPGVAAPLSVKLHGAGGDGRAGLAPFLPFADADGVLLLGIDARGQTWDVIRGGFGPDVAFLDRALARVFDDYSVDPARVSMEGFSDGASYALSLGLTNGDLFSRIVAFSPGFMAPGELRGWPEIFVSHGVRDDVLPINRCSRRIVPQLRQSGYAVEYREFFGGHTVPTDIAADAEAWAITPRAEDVGDAIGYDATASGLEGRAAPPDRPASEMVDPAASIRDDGGEGRPVSGQ